jgi:hypothetical protein
MFKTKLGLERLEDRDAPSGIDPTDGNPNPNPPPPDPGVPVTIDPSAGH